MIKKKLRKQEKQKARSKSYKRLRNIDRHAPSKLEEKTKEIKGHAKHKISGELMYDDKDKPVIDTVRTRTIFKRVKKKDNKGDLIKTVMFPKSRKHTLSKKK